MPLAQHQSQIQSTQELASLLPLFVATAHAIHQQQNHELDEIPKALSCLLLSDFLLRDMPLLTSALESPMPDGLPDFVSEDKPTAGLLPEAIFHPCRWLSLSAFREIGFTQRYDIAILLLQPNDEIAAFSDILVNCRDLSARHVLVVAPSSHNLTAFGFAKVDFMDNSEQILQIQNTHDTAWQFNLFDYKQLPDWFNSRFWANPENWNKFRW